MQTYTISLNYEEKGDVTLSLNTAQQTVELTSYGTTMGMQDFIEFAEAVSELRSKLTVLTSKTTESYGNNKEDDA